jgi:hypothetical protein
LGQARCNQHKNNGDFLQKTKMDIVFLLVVAVQVWHNEQNMSYLFSTYVLEKMEDLCRLLFIT